MYKCYKGDEIVLWCDSSSSKQKRQDDTSTSASSRQTKEDEGDSTYQTLKKKHLEKYETSKLRLWARMIVGGLHDNTDEPPDLPAFQSGEAKKKKGSTVDAIGGVMDAIARIVEQKTPQDQVSPPVNSGIPVDGVSPAKAADLRMKNVEQLCYLRGLFDDGIISKQELVEQKRIVLDALKKFHVSLI